MKPSIEEVKEYFKDAETAEDWSGTKNKVTLERLEITELGDVIQDTFGEDWLVLFCAKKGYAKILTYKTPKFEITKEQIWDIDNFGYSKVREWFPEVFKKELVVGKWYKWIDGSTTVKIRITEIDSENFIIKAYGFTNDVYVSEGVFYRNPVNFRDAISNFNEMDSQEVESALIGEAKKRYENKVINPLNEHIMTKYNGSGVKLNFEKHSFDNYNRLWIDCGNWNAIVFEDGIWAEIIHPKKMTQSEIEKELGYKIEIV